MKKFKRNMVLVFIAVIIGVFIGDFISTHYGKTMLVFDRGNSYYILQEGVYNSKEQMQDNVKNLSPKIVINKNDKYYVYVGITKNEDILEKLFNIYKEQGYTIYTKQEEINNLEFIKTSTQIDELIRSTDSSEEVLKLEELVLSNYNQKIK